MNERSCVRVYVDFLCGTQSRKVFPRYIHTTCHIIILKRTCPRIEQHAGRYQRSVLSPATQVSRYSRYVREDATNITYEYFMYFTAGVIRNLLISSNVSGNRSIPIQYDLKIVFELNRL